MRAFPLGTVLALVVLLPGRRAAGQAADGAALYRENCRVCHGAAGKAAAPIRAAYPKIPNLADSTFLQGHSEDSIVAVLRHGAGKDMKSFKDRFSAEQMVALARFVRGLARAAPKTP